MWSKAAMLESMILYKLTLSTDFKLYDCYHIFCLSMALNELWQKQTGKMISSYKVKSIVFIQSQCLIYNTGTSIVSISPSKRVKEKKCIFKS